MQPHAVHGHATAVATCSRRRLITDLQAAGPDQWVVLSTYKLLTGAKLSGNRRWDCTSSDPRKHWTSELESYCLNDLLAALDTIKPGSVVTDPATVGEAWGRLPASPPSATTTTYHDDHEHDDDDRTTVPGGAEVANPDTTVTAPRRDAGGLAGGVVGNASDDRGVAAVRVAIRNQVTGLWLQTNNTNWGQYQTRNAVLATSGATTTPWSLSVALPNGSYGLSARAVDTAGRIDSTNAWVTFTVG